jgi:hypothetical protein
MQEIHASRSTLTLHSLTLSLSIYIYIELGYGALQSTRALCALRYIIKFKLEMIDLNRSI